MCVGHGLSCSSHVLDQHLLIGRPDEDDDEEGDVEQHEAAHDEPDVELQGGKQVEWGGGGVRRCEEVLTGAQRLTVKLGASAMMLMIISSNPRSPY